MTQANALARAALAALLVVLSAALPTPRASALGAGDADAAINAYNAAFLVSSGSSAYYKKSIKDPAPDGTWVAALDIMGEEDAYDRTGSPAQKTLVDNLCATWLKNTPPGSADTPWSWDGWNDDLGWFTMMLVRGYQITGNADFLTSAQNGFNYAFRRGWDTHWNGGGIWEQQIEYCKNGAAINKETLSNDSLGIVACLLYQSTHDTAYLDKARQIYDWQRSHLFNAATGQVYTGVSQNGTVDHGTAVYNQGTFVDFANYLYQITGSRTYFADAKAAIDYTKANMTHDGILSNSAAYLNTWADTFARGLGHFVRDNHQWAAYYPWMLQNADAAWGSRRLDRSLTWNGWDKPTPTDDTLTTSKFVSAVAWLQLTPAALPSPVAGVHTIVSKRIAIDNNGVYGNKTGLVLTRLTGSQTQKWNFTQNADLSWNITSLSSGEAMDDPGGSAQSGMQMIQWQLSRDTNQRWQVEPQLDGTYKISNLASGLALSSSHTKNGQPLTQQTSSSTPQQRWLLQ